MNTLAIHREPPEATAIALPEPRVSIHIRKAVPGPADIAFIDALQKKHSKMVGFLFMETLEKKIKAGHVSIAESAAPRREPLGYCIFQDKYDKHDDCGIFYQVNVMPGNQRGLIGAALVKAALDRAAYGCKLACCWCAQDLEANYFWESLGFVPLAFRTGSRVAGSKRTPRIHIFWQRRIREGDTQTPYWFPSETQGGAVKENRLVLPIPPGTHWSDAKPAVLPGMENVNVLPPGAQDESAKRKREKKIKEPPRKVSFGVWFGPKPGSPEAKAAAKAEKPPKPKREKFKNDPKVVEAARELRDRYLEQVNADRALPAAHGKYDVSRQLEAAPSTLKQTPLLKAA